MPGRERKNPRAAAKKVVAKKVAPNTAAAAKAAAVPKKTAAAARTTFTAKPRRSKGRSDREPRIMPNREHRSACEVFAEETRAALKRSPKRHHEPVWTKAFLAVLGRSGNVSLACYAADVSRGAAYRLRDGDAGFRDGWNEALKAAADVLELEARRRAIEGVKRYVRSQGEIVRDEEGRPMLETVYSDYLLERLLKAHKPELYREGYAAGETNEPTVKVYYGIDESKL